MNTPSPTPALGYVEETTGPLVTVRFASGGRPPILSELKSQTGDTLYVVRAFGTDRVQAAATRPSALWTPGMAIASNDTPFLGALDEATASAIVDAPRAPSDGESAPSGIRTIELFAPLAHNGAVGIFAEWGVGTTVLLAELAANLRHAGEAQTIFAFVPPLRDELHWRELAAETTPDGGRVSVAFVPVADPLAMGAPSRLDAALVLSRRLAEQGVWPCIDPLESTSRLVSGESLALAERLRTLYREYYALQFGGERRTLSSEEVARVRLGRKATRLLGQPFRVAEPYTGVPGIAVDAASARAEFAALLKEAEGVSA